jgi:hypothetical protein
LRGGSDDDLLIGGTTAHDNNIAALLQILAEWTSTDDYATRTDKLRNGTGGLPKLDTTTVLDRGRHPVRKPGTRLVLHRTRRPASRQALRRTGELTRPGSPPDEARKPDFPPVRPRPWTL